MALTIANCENWVRLTLGGSPSGDTGAIKLVNLAGAHMFGMTRWKYLEGASATLDLTAAQSYIDLPADFAAPVSIEPASTIESIEWVSREQMNALRSSATTASDGGTLSVCVSTSDASGSTPATPRLEIWRTPASTVVGALTLVYRKGWAEVDDGTDYIPLPRNAPVEGLFIAILQAFARGFYREEQGSISLRLAEIQAGPLYRAAVMADKAVQSSYGQIVGSIPRHRRRFFIYDNMTASTGP